MIAKKILDTEMLITAIFVLGAFVTAAKTNGYIYAALTAVLSVLAINFAFTFPFFRLNFTLPGNLISAVIMFFVIMVIYVITARLKFQETITMEIEKEKMRGNLLRAISHDLRTPLTTIYGSSSALLEHTNEFSNEQKKRIIEGIQKDSLWLSRMVENLLSITRLDNNGVKIDKNPIVIEELVDSILMKFKKSYPDQKVEVEIPEELVIVPMDAMLIEQVAINILENAVQHAEGMTKLTFKVFANSQMAIFEIKDDGCGIPEEKMAHLFTGLLDSEAPVDSTRSNMGIGLSVCKTIIKAHGGELRAQSRPEGGTIFSFALEMEESSYV
jgi:two-component system sensor histidine kinase KdpD